MKRLFSIVLVISLLNFPIKTEAQIQGHTIVARSDKAGITLYAEEREGLYRDFYLKFNGGMIVEQDWKNVTNPAFAPQIQTDDLNGDGQQELVILLTKGTETGVFVQEVHVFQYERRQIGDSAVKVPFETEVMDPIKWIRKNVTSTVHRNQAEIKINGTSYTVDLRALAPKHLFKKVIFGNRITYEIRNHHLIARLGGEVSSAGGQMGELVITYTYKHDHFQPQTATFCLKKDELINAAMNG
ncbi:hypothetical protein PU629_08680 [Pullulanibacillus sp. KACC 23026]|uniref:hypothetical protein n=1 Tax=Pullulanibacillus sp. KACC 23026 TaxID=3028315 RepID=UPI0023B20498|nr:hypothetical protein [Pullulanibacillus sp. KACC 23026]WEG14416.1 hypothetical protein PU629_08680 [Pullulanibacillus sp. KACC 23026]